MIYFIINLLLVLNFLHNKIKKQEVINPVGLVGVVILGLLIPMPILKGVSKWVI